MFIAAKNCLSFCSSVSNFAEIRRLFSSSYRIRWRVPYNLPAISEMVLPRPSLMILLILSMFSSVLPVGRRGGGEPNAKMLTVFPTFEQRIPFRCLCFSIDIVTESCPFRAIRFRGKFPESEAK